MVRCHFKNRLCSVTEVDPNIGLCKYHFQFIYSPNDRHQLIVNDDTDQIGGRFKGLSLTKLSSQLNKVSALTDQASQVSSQVSGIADDMRSTFSGMDSNYSNSSLVASSPLGSASGNYQSFGDYVCIRKGFLSDMRRLIFELMSHRNEAP